MAKAYEDPSILEELYHGEGMTLKQIGDRFGRSRETIRLKMVDFGIPRDRPYEDVDTLRRLYAEDGLSTREIAEELDCSHETIRRWLHRHDIPVESPASERPPYLYLNKNGYVEARTVAEGKTNIVRIHRLLAVAEYGFDAVVDRDVHHKSGVPWDNRPSNIELLDRADHTRLHHTGKDSYADYDTSYRDKDTLRELYVDEGLSTYEIAQKLGCGAETVRNWLHRHDIPTRRSRREGGNGDQTTI